MMDTGSPIGNVIALNSKDAEMAHPLITSVTRYWDSLRALVDQVIAQGFADASMGGFVTWVDDAAGAVAALSGAPDAP